MYNIVLADCMWSMESLVQMDRNNVDKEAALLCITYLKDFTVCEYQN